MEKLAIVMNVRLVVDIFLVKRLEICVLMADAEVVNDLETMLCG